MLTYSPWAFYAVLAVVVAQLVPVLQSLNLHDVGDVVHLSKSHVVSSWPLYLSLLLLIGLFISRRSPTVFLVDFACANPPESWRVTHEGVCSGGNVGVSLSGCDWLTTAAWLTHMPAAPRRRDGSDGEAG